MKTIERPSRHETHSEFRSGRIRDRFLRTSIASWTSRQDPPVDQYFTDVKLASLASFFQLAIERPNDERNSFQH